MESTFERITSQLKADGYYSQAVSIGHIKDLQNEIVGRKEEHLFDTDFYKERLIHFSFQVPDTLKEAKSLIVVAIPSAQTPLKFHWAGTTIKLVLPPTYRGYNQTIQKIEENLGKLLAPEGFRVVPARLPQKLLAVHSGLAEYGRNNITYISGLGSFYQPTVFFSDMPVEEDCWLEPRMMARCESCKACLIKCPTGAIAEDRFLLHAERCLVFHNERSASQPFPDWIKQGAHNSIMGCMLCQQFCPEDRPFLDWFEGGEEFNEEETTMLLSGIEKKLLPGITREKLERLELLDDLEKLPRNLGILLRRT